MKLSIVLSICLFSSTIHARPAKNSDELCDRAMRMPDVDPALAEQAVVAAIMVENQNAPAEILLAIAWGESRFDPTIKTGHVCGPMQTVPKNADDCVLWTNMLDGFEAGKNELENELVNDPRTHGELRLALLAYACGNAAFEVDHHWWRRDRPACKKMGYPAAVFARARGLGWRPRSGTTPGS